MTKAELEAFRALVNANPAAHYTGQGWDPSADPALFAQAMDSQVAWFLDQTFHAEGTPTWDDPDRASDAGLFGTDPALTIDVDPSADPGDADIHHKGGLGDNPPADEAWATPGRGSGELTFGVGDSDWTTPPAPSGDDGPVHPVRPFPPYDPGRSTGGGGDLAFSVPGSDQTAPPSPVSPPPGAMPMPASPPPAASGDGSPLAGYSYNPNNVTPPDENGNRYTTLTSPDGQPHPVLINPDGTIGATGRHLSDLSSGGGSAAPTATPTATSGDTGAPAAQSSATSDSPGSTSTAAPIATSGDTGAPTAQSSATTGSQFRLGDADEDVGMHTPDPSSVGPSGAFGTPPVQGTAADPGRPAGVPDAHSAGPTPLTDGTPYVDPVGLAEPDVPVQHYPPPAQDDFPAGEVLGDPNYDE